jgi:hypothetical protein
LQIERHEMLGRLGGSPSTLVALVRDPGSRPPRALRALKLLDRELLGDLGKDTVFAAAVRRAGRLRHPNIVGLRGFGSTALVHHLVMEYVFGASLAQVLRASAWARTPLTVGAVLHVVASVCRALEYAQEVQDERGEPLSLVHGYITPHNILVGFDGGVKVADFGIAHLSNRASCRVPGNEPLICAYMSPEQVAGEPAGPRSDVFSLGVVLWEALSGRVLFSGDTTEAVRQAVCTRTIVRPSEATPGLSTVADELVMRALSRDPAMRWGSARAMRLAIESLFRRAAIAIDDSTVAEELDVIFRRPSVDVGFALHAAATSTLNPCDLLRAVETHRFGERVVRVLPEDRRAEDLAARELFPAPHDFVSERARPWSALPAPRDDGAPWREPAPWSPPADERPPDVVVPLVPPTLPPPRAPERGPGRGWAVGVVALLLSAAVLWGWLG